MEFPDPVISIAVEPRSKADQEKMGIALGKLAAEDPSFRGPYRRRVWAKLSFPEWVSYTSDIIVDRMKREFNVECNVGKPQVAYRECYPFSSVEAEGKFVRQSGGRGQFGHVWLEDSNL